MGTKLDYNDYGRPIPNTMRWEPAINVQIFSKKPSVKVTRTLDTEINRDGKSIVQITIENDGELKIENLKLQELIPETAVITTLPEGLQAKNNLITWSRSLLTSGDSVSFTYTIKPNSYDSVVLKNGTLTYTYEKNEFKEKILSQTIKINSPFSIKQTMSKTKTEVGQTFSYLLEVKNNDWDDTMNVEFSFSAPEQISIQEVPRELKEENDIVYDFKLLPDETKTLTIVMKTDYEGNHTIQTDLTLKIRDEVLSETKTFNVSADIPNIIPELKLSKTEVFEGSPFTITAYLENPTEITFYDVTGIVQSSMFETKNFNLKSIAPGEKKVLFEESIKAKPVDEDTSYDFMLRGRYRSPKFQYFNFEDKKTIKIKPVTIGFEIMKTLSKSEVFQKEEITVTVKAKNLGQKICVVDLEEELPEKFEVISGLTKKTMTLGIGAEEQFYLYKVRVPLDAEPGTYSLNTNLNYEGLVNPTETATVTVKSNSTKEAPVVKIESKKETKEKEAKKGLFKTIVDFFITLFK